MMSNQASASGASSTAGSQGSPQSSGAPGVGPAPVPPDFNSRPQQPTNADRTRGHSPARDSREQAADIEPMVRLADGTEVPEADLREALSFRAEHNARKATLPASVDGYELKLPPDFKAPEGMRFEFDKNDPLLKTSRELALKRGLDQGTYSDFLGLYAASKITEQQMLGRARDAELAKLGSAAPQRVEAVQNWLKGRIGAKADVLVNQLAKFPHSRLVESFEGLMSQFSRQGGADFSQSGRQQQEEPGKIPGYENMNFQQRRVAQMRQSLNIRGGNSE
jgi:hypothetical protein